MACVPKMAQINTSFCKFHSFPMMKCWLGEVRFYNLECVIMS